MAEMAREIAGLKEGKASGRDGIPAEVLQHRGDNLFSKLHQLITNAWEVGSEPQAWNDASIVTIYKKGDRTDCGNCTGISLNLSSKDPPQQTIYPHNTRGSSGDTMWFQNQR